MFLKRLVPGLLCASLVTPAVAADEQGPKVSADIGYAYVSFDTDGDLGFDTNAHSLISHIDYAFCDYLAAEAEIGIVSSPEEESQGPVSAEVETTVTLGAYLRASYPLTERVTPYFRLGYAYAEAETRVDIAGLGASETEAEYKGLAYGAGTFLNITEKHGVRAEYTVYDLDDILADAWTLGYRYSF